MSLTKATSAFASAFMLFFLGSAFAQEAADQQASHIADDSQNDAEENSQSADIQDGQVDAVDTTPAPDDMADYLNSQQQLQQTFTFRRSINGKVVETEKRTVTYDPNTPYRETEAGQTTLERLKETFDGEVLTRNEAFEEAKLDFTIADTNRDGVMAASEFVDLVASWREVDARTVSAPNAEVARQRQYDAFLAEISPETASQQHEAYALKRFMFLTGGLETVSRQEYIREYLRDFDAMDENQDTILQDDELLRFRALNRGETIETKSLQ